MFFAATLLTGALAYNATTTVEKVYTTIECNSPTTLAYGGSTYTVTKATTLTIEDCSCTEGPKAATSVAATSAIPTAPETNSTAPALANGGVAAKVGAAAGVAAAVAYLL